MAFRPGDSDAAEPSSTRDVKSPSHRLTHETAVIGNISFLHWRLSQDHAHGFSPPTESQRLNASKRFAAFYK